MKELITQRLNEWLAPVYLQIEDQSNRHIGHAGWREGGETHFQLDIVSEAFEGKSRVQRHRIVNDALSEAFQRGLHAVAIKARAPGEADPAPQR